jgi:hypothetical protein
LLDVAGIGNFQYLLSAFLEDAVNNLLLPEIAGKQRKIFLQGSFDHTHGFG